MRAKANFLCLSLLLFAAIAAHGQDAKRPLTNGQIVKLVQAEIPDQTIILVIEHSRTHFDTSPDGLLALHKSSVSRLVIDAMLNSDSKSPASQRGLTADIQNQN
jgi:hypothetical protein